MTHNPNRVYESMTCVETPFFTIRVWRDEESLEAALSADSSDIEQAVHLGGPRMNKIAECVANLPRVAAVEVLNHSRNGVLIYPDWK